MTDAELAEMEKMRIAAIEAADEMELPPIFWLALKNGEKLAAEVRRLRAALDSWVGVCLTATDKGMANA